MRQSELQIWNDAVEACRRAAWGEVEAMEREASDGMPNPARSIVRAVGDLHKSGDNRQVINTTLTAADFPSPTLRKP